MWLSLMLTVSALAPAPAPCPVPVQAKKLEITSKRPNRVGELPVSIKVRLLDKDGELVRSPCLRAKLSGLQQDGQALAHTEVMWTGEVELSKVRVVASEVVASIGDEFRASYSPHTTPGFASILPPILAVIIALLLRQALLALFAGVWLAAFFVYDLNPFTASVRAVDTHLVAAVADGDHAAIILFTMALGGMVGIMAKSGATRALVDLIAMRAKTRRAGLLTTWGAGLAIFFDDYANCMLVGNTMRPFTDRLRISREKLAYIVDSTAAPIATVAVISTWVGFQVGLFGEEALLKDRGGYSVFLALLPFSFYSFITIAFVLANAITGRDFGPMLRAERRAHNTGAVFREGAAPLVDPELEKMTRGANAPWPVAVIPVLSVVFIVAIGLYVSGVAAAPAGAGLRTIIASANSYAVLSWAAFGGSAVAMACVLYRHRLTLHDTIEAWISGMKAMLSAVLILVLAWTLGTLCKDYLQTGHWLASQISPSPALMPTITFILATAIALATGSSYSTMGIVIPIVTPIAFGITEGLEHAETVRMATLAAVLGGAVFGDHASPISDTTIMSSMASGSDHIDHVRTQAPYAAVCGLLAIVCGYIPAGFGVSPWFSLPLGIVAAILTVRFIGRPVTATSRAPTHDR